MGSLANVTFAYDFHIDRLTQKMQNDLLISGIWKPECPVKLDELRVISVSYYDLLGRAHHDGKLLMVKSAAKATRTIFKELYVKKFPFSSIETLVNYHGNIKLAEEKNVTYGFICQLDANNKFTQASWGTVLTINPTLNPDIKYINNKVDQYIKVLPKTGIFSINRKLKLNGMSEPIYQVLSKNNFSRLIFSDNQMGWKQFIYQKTASNIQPRYKPVMTLPQSNVKIPMFNYEPLTQQMMKNMKRSGTWFEGCPVPLTRLNLLTLSYYGFDKQVHTGTLIVFDAIAPYTVAAFKELYKNHFPIERFDVNHEYAGNESTAAFNCRNIVGKHDYSLHAYGLAIDINVSRNPYVGAYRLTEDGQMMGTVVPASLSSLQYLFRNNVQPGMNEVIVNALAKHGYIEWGGNWQDTIDYMHFQLPLSIAKQLTWLDKKSAEQFIKIVIKHPEEAKYLSSDTRWRYMYQLYPNRYIQVLGKYFYLLKTRDESFVIRLMYNELAMSQLSN